MKFEPRFLDAQPLYASGCDDLVSLDGSDGINELLK
jgi:hypothetical protein